MTTSQPTSEMINVEVAYATPHRQKIISLSVPAGTNAFDAAQQSGIAALFEGINLEAAKMGVFGKAIKPRDYLLRGGDRVEIYRPLLIDPKAARKARAEKAAQE